MQRIEGLCTSVGRPSTSISRFITISRSRFHRINEPKRREPLIKKEIKFSETSAYQGIDRQRFDLGRSTWQPDYYSSESYKNKRLISALGSLVVVILYFGWIREKSDLDDILSAPPHLLSANLERKMLKEEIERARKAGKDTTLLEAELEYVAVKEAALKVQFDKKK